ncbi:MAG: D-alanine--D-alanine ligase [Steroidobacteraceae bacterium]
MKIGFTYDTRGDVAPEGFDVEQAAEFDSAETIQAIEVGLSSLGHDVDRVGHVRNLTRRLAAGERWDLVFNIAEGLTGLGRESQVPALLDAFDIPYTFSDPVVLGLALHKGFAKRVIRDLGLATADFVVVDSDADLDGIDLAPPLFAKPVAGGSSMGISSACKILDLGQARAVCRSLRARFRQPVILESFLPGREFTVGIAGTGAKARVLGAMEILLQSQAEPQIYSYTNKRDYLRLVRYRLAVGEAAARAQELALRAWVGLGCRDAGRVDVRLDGAGTANFLEANPLAGLHPEHSDLVIICRLMGLSYVQLLQLILDSAEERRISHVCT